MDLTRAPTNPNLKPARPQGSRSSSVELPIRNEVNTGENSTDSQWKDKYNEVRKKYLDLQIGEEDQRTSVVYKKNRTR